MTLEWLEEHPETIQIVKNSFADFLKWNHLRLQPLTSLGSSHRCFSRLRFSNASRGIHLLLNLWWINSPYRLLSNFIYLHMLKLSDVNKGWTLSIDLFLLLRFYPAGLFTLLLWFVKICVVESNLSNIFADNTEMNETTTLQIEAKLERERTNIALLEQNLDKYNNLTKNASGILLNFEQRLLKVGHLFMEILINVQNFVHHIVH